MVVSSCLLIVLDKSACCFMAVLMVTVAESLVLDSWFTVISQPELFGSNKAEIGSNETEIHAEFLSEVWMQV